LNLKIRIVIHQDIQHNITLKDELRSKICHILKERRAFSVYTSLYSTCKGIE